ncbi:MAG: hypothetical protein E7158_06800 [Firmicutes bacterium]|nr:hypothetical protein [Bacillota bacterium]
MKKNIIEEELIKILLSEPTTDNIRQLLNADVLNKDEEKLCNEIFKNYSLIGNYQIKRMLQQLEYESGYLDSIEPKNKDNQSIAVGNLIINRRKKQNEEMYKLALNSSTYDEFNENSIDVINRRYKSVIQINEDTILRDLEDYYDLNSNEKGLSFQIDKLDELTNGIPTGVTTVIGNNREYRHVYAINLTYNMITKGKNVLYISLNYNKKLTLLDLISRHSYNTEKFNKNLSRVELATAQDENTYKTVYYDLIDDLTSHLVVFDESNFNVQNVFAIQRIIAYASKQFQKATDSSIDLIIVDGIEKLHIDTSRKVVTNRNIVESEYYSFFNDSSYPVIITNESLEYYADKINEGNHIQLCYLSDVTKYYSKVILSIRGNSASDKAKEMKLSLLKNPNDNLIDEQLITADKNYSYIKYETNDSDDAANSEVKYGRLEQGCNKLKEENRKLEQQVEDLNKSSMNMNKPVDIPLEMLEL